MHALGRRNDLVRYIGLLRDAKTRLRLTHQDQIMGLQLRLGTKVEYIHKITTTTAILSLMTLTLIYIGYHHPKTSSI